MSARAVLFCALTSVLACACSAVRPRASLHALRASDFETAITHIERIDPGSPAVLNVRLAYAGYLLGEATGSSCRGRIIGAQEQIGTVAASPKTRVLHPHGWAPVADLEYREDLALATCGSAAGRNAELYAALEAARRAITLYRSEFAYHSMVVMQFDAAVVLHELGENTAAFTALERALHMDRMFGFRKDARENDRLLLAWRGEPSGPARLAALMRNFPKRRVTLKFAWHAASARVTFDARRVSLKDGQLIHSDAKAAFERRISADADGSWRVSYAHRLSGYAPGVWAADANAATSRLLFPPAQPPVADFKVDASGKFEGTTGAKALSARLTAAADQRIRIHAPAVDHTSDTLRSVAATTRLALSPGLLEAAAAERYRLQTAMWIGATLKQGVWYEMSAPLALPGMQRIVVDQRIRFAFTRWVPCVADAAARSCAEIVLHATPVAKALHYVLADLGRPHPYARIFHYDATITARLVVDPATLLAYRCEQQIDWYASSGTAKADSVLESEQIVSTARYSVQRTRPKAQPMMPNAARGIASLGA